MSSKCVIMSGPAGAGKSTYATNLVKTYNNNALRAVIVSSDNIRDIVYGGKFPGKFDKAKEKLLWKIFFENIETFSTKYDVVILDSTCLTNKKRVAWYNRLKHLFDSFELLIVNRSLETCVCQDAQRTRHVPLKDISEQISLLDAPSVEVYTLYDEVRYV